MVIADRSKHESSMAAVAFRPVGGPSSRQPLGSTSEASVTDCDDKMLHDQNRGFCLTRQRWHESQISAGHAASCDNGSGNGVRGFDVLLKWTGSRTPVDRMVLTASGAYQARSETSPTLREFTMSRSSQANKW
ncbi:hypothetical protein Rcae01_06759 [Novipirellula caenicola]|uniref:Uncharacterized protein n=1 Tax=Novipirellula caenicola TaxID=1536901 RepID=A0ABP9W1L6_9BACT